MAHSSSPLLLLPLNPETGLDVLSIDTLPCTIGRAEGVFSEYTLKFPDFLKKVSRRHARLFVEGGTYFIQDLGSTNGTQLAGTVLGTEAMALKNGDTLSFSDFFSYTVQLPPVPRKRSLAEALAALKARRTDSGAFEGDATKIPSAPASSPDFENRTTPMRPKEAARGTQDPSEFNRLVIAGQEHFRDGAFEAAFDAYQKALELRSDALDVKERLLDTQTELNFATLLKSADGFLDAGRVDECRAAMAEAGRIKPADEALDRRLKRAQELEALENRFNALYAEGEQCAEGGAFEAALERYREALALKPENTDLQALIEDLETRWRELEAQQASDVTDDQTLGDQTILIDDSTQFLKAISHPREDEPPPQNAEPYTESAVDASTDTTAGSSKTPSVLRTVLAAFFAKQETSPNRKWIVRTLALLAILLIALALVIVISPGRKLKRLVSEGDYVTALRVAERLLGEDPADEDIGRLATQALMGVTLNPWMKQMDAGRFSDAQAVLDAATRSTGHHPEGRMLLELLNWILAVERFNRQQDTGFKLTILRDEDRIEGMLHKWETNESQYRAFLDRIPARYPAFENFRKRAYSQLSHLKAIATTEIKAIHAIVKQIGATLDKNRPQNLDKRLDDFERRYPGVGGMGRLRTDLTQYNRLWNAIESKQLVKISHLLETYQFSTPPFARKVDELSATVLPSAEIFAAHTHAGAAWRSGEGETAIAMLAPLIAMPWGEVAKESTSRYRDILGQLVELEANVGRPDYGLMVLKLYGKLRPGDDDYYINSLEKKSTHIREKELVRAGTLFKGADRLWRDYLNSDGITGYLRLESKVSPAYRRQAKRLKTAAGKVGTGNTIYRLLKVAMPKRWATLSEKITLEVEIQQIRLDGLKGVLPPGVFEQKTALLQGS